MLRQECCDPLFNKGKPKLRGSVSHETGWYHHEKRQHRLWKVEQARSELERVRSGERRFAALSVPVRPHRPPLAPVG